MKTKIRVKDTDYRVYSEIQTKMANAQQRLSGDCLPEGIGAEERFNFYQDSVLLLAEANYEMYLFSNHLKKEYGLDHLLYIDEQRNLWGCTKDE